jgi:PAS domain-containing protein
MSERFRPTDKIPGQPADNPRDKYAATRVRAQDLLQAVNEDGKPTYTVPQIREILGLTRGQYSHMMREGGSRSTRVSAEKIAEVREKLPELWRETDEQGKPKYTAAEIEEMFGLGTRSLNGVLEGMFEDGTLEPRHQLLPESTREALTAALREHYQGNSPKLTVSALTKSIEGVSSSAVRRYEEAIRRELEIEPETPKMRGRSRQAKVSGRSRITQPVKKKSTKRKPDKTPSKTTTSPQPEIQFPKIPGLTQLEQEYVDAARAEKLGDPTKLNKLVELGYSRARVIRIAEQYKDQW